MRVFIEFEPRDLWVGVHWKLSKVVEDNRLLTTTQFLDVWIGLLPMLPLHLQWWRIKDLLDD